MGRRDDKANWVTTGLPDGLPANGAHHIFSVLGKRNFAHPLAASVGTPSLLTPPQ
jgi:hypothetical protein